MEKPVLKVENLSRSYKDGFTLQIPYLEFQEGKIYTLFGPNGAGKTTLLNLLAFLDFPEKGKILFREKEVTSKNSNLVLLRKKITLVMQDPYLFKGSVIQNVYYGLELRSLKFNEVKEKIGKALNMLGLWKLRNRDVQTLSGGERQKLALARAIILDTEALLLDEPTAYLDEVYTASIEEFISNIMAKSSRTLIMATHNLEQAHRLSKEIIFLLGGRIQSVSPWNAYSAEVRGEGDLKTAQINSGPEIYVVTKKSGRRRLGIDPKNIILSLDRIESSALNSFKGKVTSIKEINDLMQITVKRGVDFNILITHKSFAELKIALGKDLYLTFKASAVEVFR
ncbi:MAG: ATP-binding cassette domain-containing protein [Candidatus Omnitrophica bacterium]|nr:ATP-binding cassette domain-containing protein [Candidatus Omnitrophota bacterium]